MCLSSSKLFILVGVSGMEALDLLSVYILAS